MGNACMRPAILLCLGFMTGSAIAGQARGFEQGGGVGEGVVGDTDCYDDPLPRHALARMGSVRLRHADWVSCLVFSADGKTFASGSRDRTIRLWDVATGKELCRLTLERGPVHSLMFSRDGRALASGSGGSICCWSVRTRKKLWELQTHQANVRSGGFSADGKLFACGGTDGTVGVWELPTKKKVFERRAHDDEIRSLSFAPDSKILATGSSDMRVGLWDITTGKQLWQVKAHAGPISWVTFLSKGKILASATGDLYNLNPGAVKLWDATTGRELRRLVTQEEGVACLSVSADSKVLASGGCQDSIGLWDVTSGKQLCKIRGHGGRITCVSFSPDGKVLASGGEDQAIHLWNALTGKELRLFGGHEEPINHVSFSPAANVLVTSSEDDTIRFWNVPTGKEMQQLRAEGSYALFSPSGKELVSVRSLGEDHVRVLEALSGREIRRFGGPLFLPSAVSSSLDGEILAIGGGDGAVHVWKAGSGQQLRLLQRPLGTVVCSIALSPNGATLACAVHDLRVLHSGSLDLWQVSTGDKVHQLVGHQDTVRCVVFCPTREILASAGDDGTVRIWEVATGKQLGQLVHEGEVLCVAFSPDGKTIASGGTEKRVRLWEVATKRERLELGGHLAGISSLVFSRDGRLVASGSKDCTALVWDITGLNQHRKRSIRNLSPSAINALWVNLADEDAAKAYESICLLSAAASQAVGLLRDHLTPVSAVSRAYIDQLITNLDSDRFAVRKKATEELEKVVELAEASLRKAVVDGKPSLELQRRIERLLEKLDPASSPQRLRALRALEVLEHIGTPEARKVLEKLAQGAPEARLTQEAKASLQRLEKRAEIKK